MKKTQRILCLVFLLLMPFCGYLQAGAVPDGSELLLSAPSAILIEKQTGQVIVEKNARERYSPASITKIMTMLLIAEALDDGSIKLNDIVTASSRAASFGGSCVYLEAGEQMSVGDMLKCISVVSANDCAVAMAEYISGSESSFVKKMNQRAAELGLEDTHFTNCSGLFDDKEHYTTAYDVALLSRALLGHDIIKNYTTIWMDSIRDGEFELSNTNKLVHWYSGCTGLKTGYTSSAMFCLAASAQRDGVEYIAVVMHAASSDDRNRDAEILLDYAFANFTLCPLRGGDAVPNVAVELGRQSSLPLSIDGAEYALVPRSFGTDASYSFSARKSVRAPVKAGDELGTLTVSLGNNVVAKLPLRATVDVPRLGFFGFVKLLGGTLFGL